ncbi:peptidase M48, partial [Thioclava sp. BHET1]
MARLLPLLLAILAGYIAYRVSTWRSVKELAARSSDLADVALRDLVARMAQAMGLREIRVRIYEIAPINGLAAADGQVYLTRGFYDCYRRGEVSAEELASVIAHELGHVALGHAKRRMIDFSGQNAMRMALGLVLSRLLPGIGTWVAQMLTSLLAARMSREDEYEADAYAAALLTKTGIGTGAQKSLFQKLDRLTGAAHGRAPAWLMSHPATAERIRAIEVLEER